MNSIKSHIDFLVHKFDLIVGISGIFLGLAIISASYLTGLSQMDIGIVLFLVSFIHVLLRNKFNDMNLISPHLGRTQKLMMNISFIFLFMISILVYELNLYFRPLSYFVIIAILISLIGIDILYFKENEDNELPILLKTLLISFNLRMGIFYNFPSILGYDAYAHLKLANLITMNGFVPGIDISGKYLYYPILHIFISTYQTVSNSCIKDALFLSLGSASILCTIFVYYIGKNVAGKKVGLLGMLLFNFTNLIIVRGIANVTPGSLVLCYFLFALYLLFQLNPNSINKVFLVFVTILMVITHQLTTFVSFLCMTFLYLASLIFKSIFQSKDKIKLTLNYIIFFGLLIQFYWMYTFVDSQGSFFEWVLRPFINVLLASGGEYGSNVLIVGYQYERSVLETALLHISYLILPFLGIGGILYCVSNKSTIDKYSIALTTILLYMLIYGIPLLGIRNLLTSRWMPILSIFLIIMASIYVFNIINLFTSLKVRSCLMFVIIFIFAFFMITTPSINKDNPLVPTDTIIRNQFTDREIFAVKTISSLHPIEVIIDSPFYSCYEFYGNGINNTNLVSINTDMLKSKTIEGESIIILRKSTLIEPISIKYSELYGSTMAMKLTKENFDIFDSNNYIYNNGQVLGYK